MAVTQPRDEDEDSSAPVIPHKEPSGGTGTLEAALAPEQPKIKRILKVVGPGLITGASDDDPSGIGTYATAGAAFGFSTLWLALWSMPLTITIQYICAKIALVSGQGLAGILRKHYPRKVLYPVVFTLAAANTINAGVDIGAIAAAINLLVPIHMALLIVPITFGILALQIWGSYRLITRIFKWLTLALFAYIGAAIFARPDWGEVLRNTLIPTLTFDKHFLTTVVAILGTTISPYLFFWQASQEVEEEVSMGRKRLWQRKGASDSELEYAAWDVNIGMAFSNVVMFFIILATGATLFRAGKTDIQSATDAAQALRPLAGDASGVLLAIGLIGAGILAVPILTGSAAYAIAEAFGWKYGLDEKPERAKQFYAVIVAATLVGMLVNFLGINPIDALFWTAVINGFLAPPMLVILMLIANNKTIMGERVNTQRSNIVGWLAAGLMTAAVVALLLNLLNP
jgi:NRAMP (natural resistance-associated macrophage protein)-like metal ion transporter